MHAYYYDDDYTVDFREDHNSGTDVDPAELNKIGVLAYHFDDPNDVEKVATERSYKHRDIVVISPETFPTEEALMEKLSVFFKEHLHEDEEIRYILDGEGFFDMRDSQDRWVRCKVGKGDLLILPAGIYHRFTLTSKNYVKTLRLFQDEPKWVAFNRPSDDNVHRQAYLKSIAAN